MFSKVSPQEAPEVKEQIKLLDKRALHGVYLEGAGLLTTLYGEFGREFLSKEMPSLPVRIGVVAIGGWLVAKGVLRVHGDKSAAKDLRDILSENENVVATKTKDTHRDMPELQPVAPQTYFDVSKITWPTKDTAA